jgi:hypothetical protein
MQIQNLMAKEVCIFIHFNNKIKENDYTKIKIFLKMMVF